MLYLDMDGVLADFEKGCHEWGLPKNFRAIVAQDTKREDMNAEERAMDDAVRDLMAQPGFFYSLPPMPDAHELWEYAAPFRPVILTARPRNDAIAETVEAQKRAWLRRVFGWKDDAGFICTLASLKSSFIHHRPGNPQVLVDDRLSNCTDWQRAGGFPILHTSADDSIRRHRLLMSELAHA